MSSLFTVKDLSVVSSVNFSGLFKKDFSNIPSIKLSEKKMLFNFPGLLLKKNFSNN